jgi:DNA-binding transcriptional ArsR family regulator
MSNYRNKEIDKYSEIFKALSNPNRLRIFARLVSCCSTEDNSCTADNIGECVGELGKDLDIAASTVSHHIKELKRAGLIELERCGQSIRCRIEPQILKELQIFFILQSNA